MRTPKYEQPENSLMDESDEVLLEMMEELKLELGDIKVSDELISKTLAKVSEQENQDTKKVVSNVVSMESMKASPKYKNKNYKWIKSISVAAAACLVVFLGINAMKGANKFESKNRADSSAYEMKGTDYAEDPALNLAKESTMKSSETQAPQAVQDGVTEGDSNHITYDVTSIEPDTGNSLEGATVNGGLHNIAYSKALESAINTSTELSKVYEYPELSSNDKAISLLRLFSSAELSVSSEEPVDVWTYYMVFSLGEEDAVVYQVGGGYVIATTYHKEEEPSQVTYEIKDAQRFHKLLLENL